MLCVEGNKGRFDDGQHPPGKGPPVPQIVLVFGTYSIYFRAFCSDGLGCRSRQLLYSAAEKVSIPLTGTAETMI